MLEQLFGLNINLSTADFGVMVAMTSAAVQILKQLLPKKVPTKIVTIIVALIISLGFTCYCSTSIVKSAVIGVLVGLVVAFVSMNGYDALKDIKERVIKKDDTGGEE